MYKEIHLKPCSKILGNVLAICFKLSFSNTNWLSFIFTKFTIKKKIPKFKVIKLLSTELERFLTHKMGWSPFKIDSYEPLTKFGQTNLCQFKLYHSKQRSL